MMRYKKILALYNLICNVIYYDWGFKETYIWVTAIYFFDLVSEGLPMPLFCTGSFLP